MSSKSTNERKERRNTWWKQHGKQVDPTADDTKTTKQVKQSHCDPVKAEVKAEQPNDVVNTSSNDNHDNDGKKNRFIVFVGNLPFDLTKEDVIHHFRCTGNVVDFRLMTKKNTGTSKGCGFLELDSCTSYEKVLNLHHSTCGGRKINVEVTCGGGGSGEKRTEKLNVKKKKFQQKRSKKQKKSEGTTNTSEGENNVHGSNTDNKTDSKQGKKTQPEKKERETKKKRKLDSVEDISIEQVKKKKSLMDSGAIKAIVKELQLEELVKEKTINKEDSISKTDKKKKKKIKVANSDAI